MALVRCPTHKIPYNDANPRGCPACAREKEGAAPVSLAQELAKAQQQAAAKRQTTAAKPAPTPAAKPAAKPTAKPTSPTVHPFGRQPVVKTPPPKPPDVERGLLDKAWHLATQRRYLAIAGAALVGLSLAWLVTSGPRFAAAPSPVLVPETEVMPLPVGPNVPVSVAFGTLGSKPAKPVPEAPRFQRFSFGADLTIDALNGIVYSLTLRIPNRSWNGLRAGLDQRTAEGTLALLGNPEEAQSVSPASQVRGGYVVYPSLETRPRRTLRAQVRPPNGCYDVLIDLQPQALGALIDAGERYAAVAREGDAPRWVLTQIRVFSRAMRGPYSDDPACR